jgi:hypothetical protein
VSIKFWETFPVTRPRLYVREGSIETMSLSAAVVESVMMVHGARDFRFIGIMQEYDKLVTGRQKQTGIYIPIYQSELARRNLYPNAASVRIGGEMRSGACQPN